MSGAANSEIKHRVFLALGANLGDRKNTLQKAVQRLPLENKKISPLFETPALLPPTQKIAAHAWNIPFLNLVVEGFTTLAATALLQSLKQIENDLGRVQAQVWAPRLIDIDILLYGSQNFALKHLQIPHPGMLQRAFVLDPLSHLAPELLLSNQFTALQNAHLCSQHQPALMGILNVTPDSFSEHGQNNSSEARHRLLQSWSEYSVAFIDLGAESTRPGARPLAAKEEWFRLEPALLEIKEFFKNDQLSPKISIDTRHSLTAARALEYGVDVINDVSGLSDPKMAAVLSSSEARYVLMHSLSVPVNPTEGLPDDADEITVLKMWFKEKIAYLETQGVARQRVILDPGLGFGKSRAQNLNILKCLGDFHELHCPLLVGHSRKSFLGVFCDKAFAERDPETLGISLAISKDIDILRVHDPVLHHRALNGFLHARAL